MTTLKKVAIIAVVAIGAGLGFGFFVKSIKDKNKEIEEKGQPDGYPVSCDEDDFVVTKKTMFGKKDYYKIK